MKLQKRTIKKFWEKHPVIYALLKDSKNPEIARNYLHNYLHEQWRNLYQKDTVSPSLEWGIRMNALRIFRRVVSLRSEKLTGFSLVSLLWNLAHGEYKEIPDELNQGFFEEINHLLFAIAGKARIYQNGGALDFSKEHGKEAAAKYSMYLNNIVHKCEKYISRYPHGLMSKVKAKRVVNRDRISEKLGGPLEDWNNYKWHLRNIIRDAKTLGKLISLSREEVRAINMAREAKLPFGITPYYVSLMDREPSRKYDHAVRAQVIPPVDYVEVMRKYRGNTESNADFMLERDTSPVELVTRRYPSIAILKPYNTCSQICVYCQRNWEIRDALDSKAEADSKTLEKAYTWFEKNPEVNEILVTGGDPFIMSTSKIRAILTRLSSMKHIQRIRFGSRTPVVLPQRITQDLVDTIAGFHRPGKREIVIVTHFEHSYEVTPEAMEAVQKFRRKGISVFNQAVFTIENSRKFELVALRLQLRLIGVENYYTFSTKGKEETRKYRVPLARLQQEVKEEARLVSGVVRTDEPVYNVPRLGKNYIRAGQHHSFLTVLPNGRRIYEFHPWEKNMALVNTYIDTDVSIYEYFKELKRRGESLTDYKSIWYYY